MFFITACVLLFIFKIRFPVGNSISRLLQKKYGLSTLVLFRKIEKNEFKIGKKAKQDIKFLTTCKDYGVLPKFVKFKVAPSSFQDTKFCRICQFRILDHEIENISRKLKYIILDNSRLGSNLKTSVSYLDSGFGFRVRRFACRGFSANFQQGCGSSYILSM